MCGSRYGVLVFLYALCVMPANVSAEYKNAEQASHPACEPRERLEWPKEMPRAIEAGFLSALQPSSSLGTALCLRNLSDSLLHLLVVFVVAVTERIDVDDFPVFKANLLHQLIRA